MHEQNSQLHVFNFRADESVETSDLLTPPQSRNARPEKQKMPPQTPESDKKDTPGRKPSAKDKKKNDKSCAKPSVGKQE